MKQDTMNTFHTGKVYRLHSNKGLWADATVERIGTKASKFKALNKKWECKDKQQIAYLEVKKKKRIQKVLTKRGECGTKFSGSNSKIHNT